MRALAEEVIKQLRIIEPERTIRLKADAFPPALGDRSMIREVFANLLSNALKYTTSRDPAVIEVNAKTEGDESVYSVKDNGVGFDMKYSNKLFEVFQRLHSAEEFEGTGIGLALVQRIIHRHGGRVWAEGQVNQGATFYFALSTRKEKEDG
jgi:light-regulated signal transduction histidine kinase (bacteriophytochrome)